MPNQTQHTPGPWYYRPEEPLVEAQNEEGFNLTIADCSRSFVLSDEEAKANARLIAASPDLLSACHEACRAAADCLPPSGNGPLDALYYKAKLMAIDEAAAKCSAAIAKATGK